jgi:hypothetical protein
MTLPGGTNHIVALDFSPAKKYDNNQSAVGTKHLFRPIEK